MACNYRLYFDCFTPYTVSLPTIRYWHASLRTPSLRGLEVRRSAPTADTTESETHTGGKVLIVWSGQLMAASPAGQQPIAAEVFHHPISPAPDREKRFPDRLFPSPVRVHTAQ